MLMGVITALFFWWLWDKIDELDALKQDINSLKKKPPASTAPVAQRAEETRQRYAKQNTSENIAALRVKR
jgi:hypothetical protein